MKKTIVKKGVKFYIEIYDNGQDAEIRVSIDGKKPFNAHKLFDNKLFFYGKVDVLGIKASGIAIEDKKDYDELASEIARIKKAHLERERSTIRYELNPVNFSDKGVKEYDLAWILDEESNRVKEEKGIDLRFNSYDMETLVNQSEAIKKEADSRYEQYPIDKRMADWYIESQTKLAKTGEAAGYADIPTEIIRKVIRAEVDRLVELRLARLNAEDERVQALVEKAKETGGPQLLREWSEECNDPNEECNLDWVYQYIDGNRKITTKRYHTY